MSDRMFEMIIDWVQHNTKIELDGKSPESCALEALDSLEMLDLITFLESAFNIQIQDRDVRPENFGTIGSLSRHVKQQKGILE